MSCPCGGRILFAGALDDSYELWLYYTFACQECGIIYRHYNDLAALQRFTNDRLDDYPNFGRKSERPDLSADASRQTSLFGKDLS